MLTGSTVDVPRREDGRMAIARWPVRARPGSSQLPGWGRWLLLGTLTPAATVLAALAFWPLWQRDPALALITSLLFAALFAIGIVDSPAYNRRVLAVLAFLSG